MSKKTTVERAGEKAGGKQKRQPVRVGVFALKLWWPGAESK
jgi:hypothetical protein